MTRKEQNDQKKIKVIRNVEELISVSEFINLIKLQLPKSPPKYKLYDVVNVEQYYDKHYVVVGVYATTSKKNGWIYELAYIKPDGEIDLFAAPEKRTKAIEHKEKK